MALISRISRLFTADVHAVLDRIEEPEVLLKQALRDMEAAVARTAQELAAARLEAERLARAERTGADALAACAGELDTCFAAGDEGLARTVLKRRLELDRRQRRLVDARAEAIARIGELETRLEGERASLDELGQKVALMSEAPMAWDLGRAEHVTAADVEVAFLEEKQRRTPR